MSVQEPGGLVLMKYTGAHPSLVVGVGDLAPSFVGQLSRGPPLKLEELRGRPVILYFFPKAGSFGCTRESQGFARDYPQYQQRGVEVVGISVDNATDMEAFAMECRLPFPLVADPDQEIARRFGVLGAFGFAKRITFFLDGQGRVVEVVDSFLPGAHVRRARERFLAGPSASLADDPSADYSRSK